MQLRRLNFMPQRWPSVWVCVAGHAIVVLLCGFVFGCWPTFAGLTGNHGVEVAQGLHALEIAQRVLDHLFPASTGTAARYQIRIRFLPSFQPDCQVLISYGYKGTTTVSYSEASIGVQRAIDDFGAEAAAADPAAVARRMKAKTRTVTVPSDSGRRWLTEFLRSLGDSTTPIRDSALKGEQEGGIVIQADGTVYSLRYEGPTHAIALDVAGPELGEPIQKGDLPVVQWMIAVRKEFLALPPRQ